MMTMMYPWWAQLALPNVRRTTRNFGGVLLQATRLHPPAWVTPRWC